VGTLEGRGHADGDAIASGQHGEIGSGSEVGDGGQRRRGDILDVRFAPRDGIDLARVQVYAGDGVARLGKAHSQGQPYIAQADHGHMGIVRLEFGNQFVFHTRHKSSGTGQ